MGADELTDRHHGWAAAQRKLAPAVKEAARAYPAARRVYSAASAAERRRLDRLPITVVARLGVRSPACSPRGGRRIVGHRRVVRRSRSRSPGRLPADDDPHQHDLVPSGRAAAA